MKVLLAKGLPTLYKSNTELNAFKTSCFAWVHKAACLQPDTNACYSFLKEGAPFNLEN